MKMPVDVRLQVGPFGVLIAAILAELNDQITFIAVTDVGGAMGISADPGTWLESLYISAGGGGMTLSSRLAVTFSPRRFVLFVIGLSLVSTLLIPLTVDLNLVYVLRTIQGLAGGFMIPLLMAIVLRATPPSIRLYGLAVYALTATVTRRSGRDPGGAVDRGCRQAFRILRSHPARRHGQRAGLVWPGDGFNRCA
jgi:MFS transporter, DHA2 family, multidrug resistance protein